MIAYIDSTNVGEVTGCTWRTYDEPNNPDPKSIIVGSLVLDSRKLDVSDFTELTLLDTQNGIQGTVKFLEFQITQTVETGDQVGVSFIAKSVIPWKPL